MGILSALNIFGTENTITAEELKGLLKKNEDIAVVDVRPPGEYTCEHIPGSVNIPYETILDSPESQYGVIQLRNRIVLCCANGSRSPKAMSVLASRGIKNIICLKGGMKAWLKAGYMTISD